MFSKRTIQPHQAVTHVDTAVEALAVSIGERARVDLPFMARLSDKTEEELVTELRGVIFRVPGEERDRKPLYQAADEYLSGDVRKKLSTARQALVSHPEYAVNVDFLEKALPKDLDASEIDVSLGADWVGKEYYQDFMIGTFRTPIYLQGDITVQKSEYTSEWRIKGKRAIPANDVTARVAFGTERMNAYEILENTLNLRDVRIYDAVHDPDGKERRMLNKNETTLAQQKQQTMNPNFPDKPGSADMKETGPVKIGTYRLAMSLEVRGFGQEYRLTLKGKMSYAVDLGKDPKGNLTRIENALAQIPNRITAVEKQLENLAAQMEAAKAEIGEPFPQEEELKQKSACLAFLNIQLDIDGQAGRTAGETVLAKSARPRLSVLESLKRPLPPRGKPDRPDRPKHREPER